MRDLTRACCFPFRSCLASYYRLDVFVVHVGSFLFTSGCREAIAHLARDDAPSIVVVLIDCCAKLKNLPRMLVHYLLLSDTHVYDQASKHT